MASKLYDYLMQDESNLVLTSKVVHHPSFTFFNDGLFIHSTITKFIRFMVEHAHLLGVPNNDACIIDLVYVPRMKHWSALKNGVEEWEHVKVVVMSMNEEDNIYESFTVLMPPHGVNHNSSDYFYLKEDAEKYNTFLSLVEDLVKMPIEQYTQGTFKYAEIV